MEKEIEFDKQDWAAMHDAFMHVTGRKPSQEELETLFGMLPHDLQGDAKEWGMWDTLWRDRFIEWFQQHLRVRFPSDKRNIQLIMTEALHASYGFHVDKLVGPLRERTDTSFDEAMDNLMCGAAHWTLIYRKPNGAYEMPHWEFCGSTMYEPYLFLWVRVRPEKAEEIITKYGLR
jgi:hypothetical protein